MGKILINISAHSSSMPATQNVKIPPL